jgi:formylglycine-generating enzyme required for sulfatase activity
MSASRPFGAVAAICVVASVVVGGVVVGGCVARGEASVLLSVVGAGGADGLVGVRARLTLSDSSGRHPALRLRLNDVLTDGVEAKDVPLPCDENGCGSVIDVDPGTYDVELVVSALDRCTIRGDVLRYTGTFSVRPWDTANATLELVDASFDGDDDGVIDVLEASGCGRFDIDDGIGAPSACGPGREGCCPESSPLIGGQMFFAGGPVTLPYDRDGDDQNDQVVVGPFAIDATEFTWGALARCVAAGVCLAGQPEHPARQILAGGVDPRVPAQGLLPADAEVACGFFGRRLPHDEEWYYAAAVRDDDDGSGTYPFDVDDGVGVGCLPDDPPPAARYRAAGRACGDGTPLPVGSYVDTVVDRGQGTPLADMAGNVAEWTVIAAEVGGDVGDDVDGDGVPDGAAAIALRGGGATSFIQLLENSLVLVFDANDVADVARVRSAAPVAGFRCASDDVLSVDEEPVCPSPDQQDVDDLSVSDGGDAGGSRGDGDPSTGDDVGAGDE